MTCFDWENKNNMKSSHVLVRWSLMVLLMIGCSCAGETARDETEKSCRDFVQGFYDWYVPIALKEGPLAASDRSIKEKSHAFSNDLIRALVRDSEAQEKVPNEIVGLDFDPFLNSQDPSTRYVVKKIKVSDERCFVEMVGASSGDQTIEALVTPELIRRNGQWIFVNFHYGETKDARDENLVSVLQYLQAKREKN